MKRAIVSLATERGNYYQGIARLADSLKGKFSGNFLGFMGEESIGAEKHLDNPYSFKLAAINQARLMGYTSIMWLDSSVFAIRNVDHLFDIIECDGYLMQDSGNYLGNWCNDKSLSAFDVNRDQAMNYTMYGNAGLLGLNFLDPIALSFFDRWIIAMKMGLFKGAWDNSEHSESLDSRCKGHRHEMAVGSLIAWQLGMRYHAGDTILQYASPETEPINETICLFAAGM
jgi:hypothetical protein